MKKKTYIAWVTIIVIAFAAIPFFWKSFMRYALHQPNAAIDWNAWWTFGTFLLAIIAACIAWFEYEEANQPQLFVYLFKEDTYVDSDGNGQFIQYAGLRLENIGKTPALNIRVTLAPGIPWPLGSHPAGDPQQALIQRKISHLAANKATDLLFADRTEFDKVISQENSATQTIRISYKDARNHCFGETYVINLCDVAYLQSTKTR